MLALAVFLHCQSRLSRKSVSGVSAARAARDNQDSDQQNSDPTECGAVSQPRPGQRPGARGRA